MKTKIYILLIIISLFVANIASAIDKKISNDLSFHPRGFTLGDEVEKRIGFWKLIFAKYGKDQLVFHHREHPEIVYSVLDLTEYVDSYSGKELLKQTNQAIVDEIERIKKLLIELSNGKKPDSPSERRILHLFADIPGSLESNLRAAASEDLIRNQSGIKERFEEGLKRSGRYLPAMEKIFLDYGLPPQLTRVPMIESSFDYTAYSSVGAAGIWQFMRATGKNYMRVDNVIDERRDPIVATRAAAKYLKHAYDVLGAWPLAITSYNHGINGILKASKSVGTRDINTIIQEYDGDTFGFASKNFYPEFMAALEIDQNIEKFFPGLRKYDFVHFEEVTLPKSIGFKELVKYSQTSSDVLEDMNRQLMKPIISGNVKIPSGVLLKIPTGKANLLLAKLGKERPIKSTPLTLAGGEKIITKATSHRHYVVQSGDTSAKIAKKLGISVKTLLKYNPQLKKRIKAGEELDLQ